MQQILERAGGTTDSIGHVMLWTKDRSCRDAANPAWLAMFPDEHNRPCRHAVSLNLDPGIYTVHGRALVAEAIDIADPFFAAESALNVTSAVRAPRVAAAHAASAPACPPPTTKTSNGLRDMGTGQDRIMV